jgi:hypothetical protein
MKFLALEQQKEKKYLKSVFHFSIHVLTSKIIFLDILLWPEPTIENPLKAAISKF